MKKDDSPQYKESFNFKLDEEDLEQAGLKLTCMQQQPLLEKGEGQENRLKKKNRSPRFSGDGSRSQVRPRLGLKNGVALRLRN